MDRPQRGAAASVITAGPAP
ncbi:hypothetical protein MTO96_022915, partial [Rhipicephalus appendiculatus]